MKRILVVVVAAILAWCGFTFFSNHAGAEAHAAGHGHEHEHEEVDFDNIPLSQNQVDAVDLKMGEAVDRVMDATIAANGQLVLRAQNKGDVASLMGGVVKAIYVKEGQNVKRGQVVALCDKAGAVIELKKRDSSDLSRFIRSRLEPKGCTVSKACCDLLIERCEKNMLTLSGELEKLAAYVQGEWNATPQTPVELTEQMIETVTCKTVNASVYDLARAILADRFEKAMRIVEDLLYLRYQPTAILAALSGAYLDLYIAKTAREMGQGEEAIKQNFSYKGRDFVVRNSLRDCSRYSLRVLERSVICLAQTDHRMKSSRADPTILLEQAVTQLFVLASEDK